MSDHSSVGSCETHLSRLFFTPDRVFKLLKPVSLPFVDFSDRDARLRATTVEFERNRALSPDVYLGLADVVEHGELVDRMIVMRRLPESQELTRLLNDGDHFELIRSVARHVASIHAGVEPLHGDAAWPGSLEAITENWEGNLAAIAPHVGSVIDSKEFDELIVLVRSYLSGRADLFEARIAQGWIRDGHGDLRTEHVYLTDDGPRLIDCVAFDDRLRISDALADVAFLAMDLDRQVGPLAAMTLMRAWNEFTNEHHPSSLAHFYVAYRAHVRCKIACLRHAAGQPGAAQTARSYHAQAIEHLRLAQIRMVIVGGGPGTGKSTIAERIAQDTGATWLRADEIRKDVAGVAHDSHSFAAPGEGIYTAEITTKTHAEMVRQAETLITHGTSVVVDATWRSGRDREAMREVARRSGAWLTELRCVLPPAIAKERIARRMSSIHNPSDATPELVDVIEEGFDHWPEAIELDTAHQVKACFAAAQRALHVNVWATVGTKDPAGAGGRRS